MRSSLSLVFLLSVASTVTAIELEHQESRDLVELVTDAATLVSEKGLDAACAEFRSDGSRWLHDETYVFVLGMADGETLCHPGRPQLEGRAILEMRDPQGRPIVQSFIRDLSRSEEGWEHYLWPRRGDETFLWKTSYVRRAEDADGTAYVVGSGLYEMPMERSFIVDQVDDAVALLEADGADAFTTLRDPASGFSFYDAYVFVMAEDGTMLVNAGLPELEGNNFLEFTDADGKVVGREMLTLLEQAPSGWVEYLWPRPGNEPATRKTSYVRRTELDGKLVVVGAGMYLPEP